MSTIYECYKNGKDVNKSLQLVHHAQTEALAIEWLEKNGGGNYKNVLHNFQFYVTPKV